MLDHVAINVRSLSTTRAFYERALAPLGYGVGMEVGEHVGFRSGEGELDFWLSERGDPAPTHVAFRARDRQTVDAYHAAAVAAGGADNGAPGIREEFHENYYAAYVLDPEGKQHRGRLPTAGLRPAPRRHGARTDMGAVTRRLAEGPSPQKYAVVSSIETRFRGPLVAQTSSGRLAQPCDARGGVEGEKTCK